MLALCRYFIPTRNVEDIFIGIFIRLRSHKADTGTGLPARYEQMIHLLVRRLSYPNIGRFSLP